MGAFRVAYNTDRLEETIRFWCDGLDRRLVRRWTDDHSSGAIIEISADCEVELFAAPDGSPPLPVTHGNTFQVMIPTADPEAAFAQVQQRGLPVDKPLAHYPWADQFTLRDPNGVEVYMYRSLESDH